MSNKLLSTLSGSAAELRKVVWPTRAETLKTSLAVFGVVCAMSGLVWGADKLFEYLLYGQLLHWTH